MSFLQLFLYRISYLLLRYLIWKSSRVIALWIRVTYFDASSIVVLFFEKVNFLKSSRTPAGLWTGSRSWRFVGCAMLFIPIVWTPLPGTTIIHHQSEDMAKKTEESLIELKCSSSLLNKASCNATQSSLQKSRLWETLNIGN